MNEPEAGPNMEKKCPQCGAPLPAGGLAGLCPACLLAQGAAETASDTPPFQPPTVAEVAALFPQLEILSLIGKGGMGAVYQARQPVLDRIVALKILPPQTTGGPDFTERFNREARALARLNHPNIITVHEFGQVQGMPFFIMEYVDGLNLRQLEQAGKLTPREALQIVPQICEALQFAHDAGIVHRDIKPDNILLDKKGRVKIADFGIAKILGNPPETGVPETQGAIGTPHYMAPEQVEKPQSVDHRADIFSLGVVFYEMLTGELPLGKFAPPSAGAHGVRVDVRLDEVVLRALEKEPDRRYQHASQVKTAVETIANTPPGAGGMGGQAGGVPPPPLSPPGSPPPPPGPSPEAILARDYTLKTGHCLERGWALVKSHFWELVGIHALILLLLIIAGSAFARTSHLGNAASDMNVSDGTSVLGLVLGGPLWAGLFLYFLKTIRGEPVTVETAFSGFSKRFLHLFLLNLVAWVLIGLGFICFILPGVYLLVAWCFSLVLVMDKGLDFWPAMELSRKVVNKHWWKVFGFLLVLAGVWWLGVPACCIGVLVSAPVAIAVFLYAYEDIFGQVAPATPAAGRPWAPPPISGAGPAGPTGPAGTVVIPPAPLNPPPPAGSNHSALLYVLIAAAVVLSLPALFYVIPLIAVLLALLVPFFFMSQSIHHGLPPHLAGWGWGNVWLEIGSIALVFALLVLGLILTFKVIFNLAKPAVSQSSPPRSAAGTGPGVPSSSGGGSRFLKYAFLAMAGLLALLLATALAGFLWLTHSAPHRTFQVFTAQPIPPVMPLPPQAPFASLAPTPPAPPAGINTNEFNRFLKRTRQELDRNAIRFNQLQLSSPNESQLFISLTGLQTRKIVNGTTSWQNIVGLLEGTRDTTGKWFFNGQGQLVSVHYDLAQMDLGQVLAAARWLENQPPAGADNSHF
jgi:predicted Ser/Thr protein kinase